MLNDSDYEVDVKDANMRTKGRKNRQSKEFKRFAKSGIVRKLVVSDQKTTAPDSQALSDSDPFGMNFSVQYSLNKKGRWAAIPTMRAVDKLEDEMGTKVSTMENVFLPSLRCGSHRGLCSAYHEVNKAGDVDTKHSKRFLAQEQTLTTKPRLIRKLRNETKTGDGQDNISDATTHTRYEIDIPHPSEKYWQQMSWRQHDFRPSDKVFNARARKISESDYYSVNDSDDVYLSNSDTESDATEKDNNENVDLSERRQFSLSDYITGAEKKPKKSESFVFVNM